MSTQNKYLRSCPKRTLLISYKKLTSRQINRKAGDRRPQEFSLCLNIRVATNDVQITSASRRSRPDATADDESVDSRLRVAIVADRVYS